MLKINLIQQAYGNMAIAKKLIMSRALELHNKLHKTLSEALKQAWREAKQIAKEYIDRFIKNIEQIKYRLMIESKIIELSYSSSEHDVDEVVENCMEHIAENKGKQYMYNVSKRIYTNFDLIEERLSNRKAVTFGQDVYVVRI